MLARFEQQGIDTVAIPKEHHSKGGAKLGQMDEMAAAKVTISRPVDNSDGVIIRGGEEGIDNVGEVILPPRCQERVASRVRAGSAIARSQPHPYSSKPLVAFLPIGISDYEYIKTFGAVITSLSYFTT